MEKLNVEGMHKFELYAQIEKSLSSLNINTGKSPFNINLGFETNGSSVDSSIKFKLLHTIEVLTNAYRQMPSRNLESFISKFEERFDRRGVPLLQALDPNYGIDYQDEQNLGYPRSPLELNNEFSSLLARKLETCIREHKTQIEINSKEVIRSNINNKIVLPETFAVFFSIINSGTNEILFHTAGGATAAANLGRFSDNSKISQILARIGDFEEIKNHPKITAEILHLPKHSTGDLLIRAPYRNYEMPYLAKSLKTGEHNIRLDDIWLFSRNRRLILWNYKLQKEVMPLMGSAHIPDSKSLPVYRFLHDIQRQGKRTSISFSWGHFEKLYSFFPRVVIDSVTVSPAIWLLRKADIIQVLSCDDENLTKCVAIFQNTHKIPNKILLAGETDLFFDLQSSVSIKNFIKNIQSKQTIKIKEYLFDGKNSLIKDSKGKAHDNELFAIVKNCDKHQTSAPTNFSEIINTGNKTDRDSLAGDRWLYYKIYLNISYVDRFISEHILKLIEILSKQDVINKWFFLKYNDPEFHIRIRFLPRHTMQRLEIMNIFNIILEEVHAKGLIIKTQIDTYARELEKYGAGNIDSTEELFCIDSAFAAELIRSISMQNYTKIKLWTMLVIDAFLSDFDFQLTDKKLFMQNFMMNLRDVRGQRTKKNDEFSDMKSLRSMLTRSSRENEDLQIYHLIQNRSAKFKPVIDKIKQFTRENNNYPLPELLRNYIHMSINRIMGSTTEEAEVYQFLSQYYVAESNRT